MKTPERVVLVTGAARRIGAQIARRLHADGMNVAIHCRSSRDEADALAAELNRARWNSARVVAADLLDTAALPGLVEQAHGAWGRLDALVNNASTFYPTPVGSIDENAWADLVGSNLKAPLFLSQAAAPLLKKSKGAIVNIVDIHASRPLAGYVVYGAAKAGLLMLTRALARDLAPDVRVNAVAPGTIIWPENDDMTEAARKAVVEATPMKRLGSPEDIAAAVRFLLSEDAGFVTGQVLTVDGGRGISWI